MRVVWSLGVGGLGGARVAFLALVDLLLLAGVGRVNQP